MPTLTGFARPTLEELIARSRTEYQSRIPGADALLGQGELPRLPEIDAELAHDQHAHLDFIARQAMPLFATAEDLDLWGFLWGIARKPASKAAGPVTFTGTNGAEIPIGAALVRSDGVGYTVTAGAAIAGGTATVIVEADQAGLAGNALAGQALTLASPIAGVDSQGQVAAGGLVGGAEVEADGRPGVAEHYRGRILDRIRQPPHGGADFDYVKWTLEVEGVTRAWVYPQELGLGTVTVRFMMDDAYANGIPQAGDVAAVAAYIEEHEDPLTGETVGRPVTAAVTVVAPIPVALNITIADLAPDTADIRAAIAAELKDMLRRRAVPGGTIRRSWIWEAVSVAAGEDSHAITAPAGDVAHGTGEIAVLGVITYV